MADAQLCKIYNRLLLFCVLDSSSEEDEEEDEEEEEEVEDYGTDSTDRLSSPALDESGLGLLARFAASAMPSPIVPPPLSIIQLEAKQKAKKKEERQSLMGESCAQGSCRGEGGRFRIGCAAGKQILIRRCPCFWLLNTEGRFTVWQEKKKQS